MIHKTAANILNFTTLSRQTTISTAETTKRIPVPDPGVPALPETDTSTPSPSSWHCLHCFLARTTDMLHSGMYNFHRQTDEEQKCNVQHNVAVNPQTTPTFWLLLSLHLMTGLANCCCGLAPGVEVLVTPSASV
ncbi:hypothetical protein ACLKA7_008582 [Drosophila subpalustris]